MRWIIRAVQGVLAAVFLMSGLMKVFISSDEIRSLYSEPLGYAAWFMRGVGIVEAAAAIGLIAGYRWPKLAFASSGVLAIVMAAAAISVLLSEQGASDAVVPIVLLALALYLAATLRRK